MVRGWLISGGFLLISFFFRFSNTTTTSNLLIEAGNFEDRMETIIDGLPDKFKNHGGPEIIYTPPTLQEQSDFANEVFRYLYYSQFESAATNALDFGYTLTEFTEGQNVYYILERDLAEGVSNLYHWGTYVFNPNASKGQLIIQSPHPLFDSNTGVQAARVFQHVEASFLFITGAHRCNSPVVSGCSGTSNACNSSIGGVPAPAEFLVDAGDYRESDVAHASNSMFDYLTRWLEDEEPDHYYYIQLHGFGQGGGEPDLILSNGKDENHPAPDPDILSMLSTQLILEWDDLHNEALEIEIAHDDDDNNFNTLLATTNTQGRYINGNKLTPCSSSLGTVNTGRFIHIEQGRINDATQHMRLEGNWVVLINAINNVFLEAPLPVVFISFNVDFRKDHVEVSWVTASEEGNDHFEVEKATKGSDFRPIAIVTGQGTTNYPTAYRVSDYDLSDLAYYRIKQYDLGGNITTTEIRSIDISAILDIRTKVFLIRPNFGTGDNINVSLSKWVGKASLFVTDITGKVNLSMASHNPGAIEEAIKDFCLRAPTGKYTFHIEVQGQNLESVFLKY